MKFLKFSSILFLSMSISAWAQTTDSKKTPVPKSVGVGLSIPPIPAPTTVPALTTRTTAPPNPFAKPSKANKQTPPPESMNIELPPSIAPPLPLSPSPMEQVVAPVEEIQAIKIGEVNGLAIYRGNNLYHFESGERDKIKRKVIPPASRDAFIASSTTRVGTATNPAGAPINLPSSVGTAAPPPVSSASQNSNNATPSTFAGPNSKPFESTKTSEKSTFPKF